MPDFIHMIFLAKLPSNAAGSSGGGVFAEPSLISAQTCPTLFSC
jgi:hypothetical protein